MAATQSGPELSVVKPESAGAEPVREDAPPRPTRPDDTANPPLETSRRGLPWWALLLSLAVGAALLLNQYERAERFSAEVAALRSELSEADQKLAVYASRLSALRAGIDDLIARVGALGALAHGDPTAAALAPSDAFASSLAPGAASPSASSTPSMPHPSAAVTLPARLPSAVLESTLGDTPQALSVSGRAGSPVGSDHSEVVRSALSVSGIDPPVSPSSGMTPKNRAASPR